jgi:hypothetical protein
MLKNYAAIRLEKLKRGVAAGVVATRDKYTNS